MIAARTCLFFLGWISFTLTVGLLALPALISRRAIWWAARFWATGTLKWLRLTCGITSGVRGAEHLRGAKLVASKHQSAWDTLVLWCVLKNPVFVLKRELYWIPIFGWHLWRTGQIAIDRSNPKDAMERIAAGMKRYEGRVLVIFPEGTRVPPGAFKPFRYGIGRISAMLDQSVVPAALNAGLFWPKRPLWKRPGHAVIAFLPAVPPASAENLEGWVKDLENLVLTETRKLSSPSAI